MKFTKPTLNEVCIWIGLAAIIITTLYPTNLIDPLYIKIPGEFKNSFKLICLSDNIPQLIALMFAGAFIIKDILEAQRKYSPSENILDDEP